MLERDAIGEKIPTCPYGYVGLGTRRTIGIYTRHDNVWTTFSAAAENHIVPVVLFPRGGTYREVDEVRDTEKFGDVCFGAKIDTIQSVNPAIAIHGILYSAFLLVIDLPLNTERNGRIGTEISAEVLDLLRKKKQIIIHKKELLSTVLFR